jgi:hypothetical protein
MDGLGECKLVVTSATPPFPQTVQLGTYRPTGGTARANGNLVTQPVPGRLTPVKKI